MSHFTTTARKPHNHWSDSGDLVIEERTLFRQVGWIGQTAGQPQTFYPVADGQPTREQEPGAYAPVYQQIATDHGDGWED